jgi:hypothetical protein
VCDADLKSRQFLLHSSAARFLSARLINSPVPLLSQLSLLLLHECLAVSPQIIVDFHPRQFFTWIIANETYAELAIEFFLVADIRPASVLIPVLISIPAVKNHSEQKFDEVF